MPVLVVDDNEASRELLEEVLRSYQLQPRAVANGEAALRELRQASGQEPYRLVVMDWRMPGLDGLELSRRILSQPEHAEMPIIMVTAYGREEVRRKAEGVGVRGFLHKPVKPSVLFDTLVGILGAELAEARARTHEELRLATQAMAVLSGVRVLLVEDNPINQQVATELLAEAGVRVEVANDGVQAAQALARGTFDAVLMDVQMPRMDGYRTTGFVRGTQRWPEDLGPAPEVPPSTRRVPIVAMTAHALEGDRERCLSAGMDDYITKPIDSARLFQVLARWVAGAATADVLRTPAPASAPRAQRDETPPPLPEQLPGVDLQAALAKLGGRDSLLLRVLGDFRRDNMSCVEELRAALAGGELDLAVRMAHTVKGVAGLFCARKLVKTAAELEAGLRAADDAERQRLLARFGATLLEVLDGIGTWQRRKPKELPGVPPPESPVGDAELRSGLAELRELLSRRSMKAQRRAAALVDAVAGRPGAPLLGELRQALGRFDFRAAAELAERLAVELGVEPQGGEV